MLKALFRTILAGGFAYGAYVAARRYWGDDVVDNAIDSAKNTALEFGKNIGKNDEHLTATMKDISSRKAM